jgi:hypothetical protein
MLTTIEKRFGVFIIVEHVQDVHFDWGENYRTEEEAQLEIDRVNFLNNRPYVSPMWVSK